MADYDDIKTWNVALVGFIGAVLVFALIVLLEVVYYRYQTTLQNAQEAPAEVANLVAKQQGVLASYSVIDPKKDIYGIPISRAMDLVVSELSSGVSAAAKAPAAAPRASPAEKTANPKGAGHVQ